MLLVLAGFRLFFAVEESIPFSLRIDDRTGKAKFPPAAPADINLIPLMPNTGGSPSETNDKSRAGSGFTAFAIKVYDRQRASSERITVGSKAPVLKKFQHAGGEQIPNDIDSRIRIINFWASWHPLSLQSLRRLSGLQREFGDRVFVIHITEETPAAIQTFLKSKDPLTGRVWGEQTAGAVIADTAAEAHSAWMQGSMFTALPAAFLVGADGILQWFGAAGSVESPLRKLVDQKWTIEEAAVQVESSRRVYDVVSSTARPSGLLDAIREASEAAPEDLDSALMLLDFSLEAEDYRLAAAAAETAFGLCRQSAEGLNSLAWVVISGSDSRRAPMSTALRAAVLAAELTNRSSQSLETLARVHMRMGEFGKAVIVQREAVAGAEGTRRELQEAILREYERLQMLTQPRR